MKAEFIMLAGRLVRMSAIVEVTADNLMQLSTGTVIPVDADDAPILKATLANEFGLLVSINAAPQPVPNVAEPSQLRCPEEIFHDVQD